MIARKSDRHSHQPPASRWYMVWYLHFGRVNNISKLGTTYSTYENHSWLRLLILLMIYLWFTYGRHLHVFAKVTYDLLMIYLFYLWFTYDLLMIYLWFTYDLLIIYLCFTYDLLMIYLWFTYDVWYRIYRIWYVIYHI